MGGLDVYLYDHQVEQGARSARNLSYFLANQTDRSLQSVLSTVSNAIDRLQREGIGTIGALKAAAVASNMQAMLHDRLSEDPFLDSVFIVAADGKIINPDSERVMSIAD